MPQSTSALRIPVSNGQSVGTPTELLVQILLGLSCPDTLLVMIFRYPMPHSEAPIQQRCIAFIRVSGRNNGAHIYRITIFAKVQAIPHERYVLTVESQGKASVNNITHRAHAILDQFVLGDVEDSCYNPQPVECVAPRTSADRKTLVRTF